CLSAKTTAWNEFSSTMASAIICLADNQSFSFSKYIFDNMVKSLEGGIKLYLFPRFLQIFLNKQVEGMVRYKEMYIIYSHAKKIFANIRRMGVGFSGVITHLFDTMMVQATANMGDTPVKTHQPPIVDQPSTSRPQKKQKPRRKQRNEAEVSHDESEDGDHVPTPSSDPLPSEAKDAQSKEIDALKKKVSKLLKWRKTRSGGLRRLMKIGLDADTQGMKNNDEMFGVDDLSGEEVVLDTTTGEHEEQIIEDITMAQALAALRSIKPKVVVQEQEVSTTIPAAATTVTTDVPTPRAKGGYKHSYLKGRSYDEIKKLFDREMRKVNDFIAMDSEAQKSSGKKAQESSTKITAKSLESDISKKQKVDENVEPVIDDTKELKNVWK
nr:hypothetical protein [Tanacetum cinerariifolium]